MTNQPNAQQAALKTPGKVTQFRLYKDSNLLIPINKGSKTQFVHDAVAAAANEPALLGWALVKRGTRSPQTATQTARISIATTVKFQENVEALSTVYRMANEEIVRLAVEAAVYEVDQRDLIGYMGAAA